MIRTTFYFKVRRTISRDFVVRQNLFHVLCSEKVWETLAYIVHWAFGGLHLIWQNWNQIMFEII
jgi:hypothetical protein